MERVTGVGFDLDHTLAIDNRLERVAFLRLLEVLLAQGGRTVGTLADEIDDIDSLLARQRSGEFSIEGAVRRFVTGRGMEPAPWHVETFENTAVEMVDEFLVPLPGARQMLDALRERQIATAILSNGWNPLQRRKAVRIGFLGTVLVSSEIGEQKPARGAFDALLRSLGTHANETMYVGDDARADVAGAQDAGMLTVWMNWERKAYPADVRPPSHTIADLHELLDLIPAPARIT